MHPRSSRSRVLVSLALAFALTPGATHALPAASDAIRVVETGALSAAQLDELYALEQVEAWVEFGNTSVIVGAAFDGELARFFEGAPPVRSLEGRREDLAFVRFEAAHADRALPAGSTLVAGFGRYAVVLVGDAKGVRESAVEHTAHPTELRPVPWNTIVVRRPDRQEPLPVQRFGADATLVEDAVAALDTNFFSTTLLGLVNFGTRFSNVASFSNVTTYVEQRFAAAGLAPTREAFQLSGKTRHNVIAEIPGTTTPQDVYVICGHYDSTSQSPSTFAPGADDNASGAAGVIEMARALSGFRFDSTLRFIAFSGEEQGLVGSNAHVNKLKSAGQLGRVKGVINMDMIAYQNTGRRDVLIEGSASASAAMMSLLSSLVGQHTNLVPFTSTNPFGSDHMPYINNGVNAVLTIEYEDWFNPNYHSTADQYATLTLPLAHDILRLNLAAIATAAGINGRAGAGMSGMVEQYGLGLGGTNIGAINSGSAPKIGTTMSIDVTGMGSATFAQVALCRRQANVPGFGGTILVDLSRRIRTAEALLVGGNGTVGIKIPNQLNLIGVKVYLQAAAGDPGQPSGVALSNGLEVTIGS